MNKISLAMKLISKLSYKDMSISDESKSSNNLHYYAAWAVFQSAKGEMFFWFPILKNIPHVTDIGKAPLCQHEISTEDVGQ